MIPSVIASQVRRGIEDFLRTTYPPEDPFFADLLEAFFREEGSLFRGPFLSLKLPFRPGRGKSAELYPELPMKFAPYLHQELAFARLSGENPKSTLIATGTGSGKTECFMYPLLDYCYRHRGARGVKAIIIYPMNALATDQAKRFAQMIYNSPALKGNVSVGLFIGGQEDTEGFQSMTAESVITCKDTLRKFPPDILLTNYKMLDFLLLRPKDYPIWQYNDPETLKYIVIDELHTFDGAQGTDLACLLRRLLRRLNTTADKICFAGTSATLGSGNSASDKMLSFAGKLFGVAFDNDAIIREDTLKPSEFLGDDVLVKNYPTPTEAQYEQLQATHYATEMEYLQAQCHLWFGEDFALPVECGEDIRFALGDRLREHLFFQNLIRILNNETIEEETLASKLNQIIKDFTRKPPEFQAAFIDSIFALISFARRKIRTTDGRELAGPFLQVRVQLWLREMRRMVATVEDPPRLRYAADLRPDESVQSLPVIHCRDCGHVGYLSIMPQTDHSLCADLNRIYASFFASSPTIQYIFHNEDDGPQGEFPTFLCGHCLTLSNDEKLQKCPACGKDDKMLRVRLENPRQTNANGKVHVYKNCPFCHSSESLTVLGSRSASLTSVVISQLFASQYNDDAKLLAFSDSVQDASHRAGFFSARTYRFNLRAAIQQVLDESKEPLTLESMPPHFVQYWEKQLGGKAPFIAQFIPPDLQWYKYYEEMLAKGTIADDSPLFQIIKKRIHWEILSEYGYRSRIGRTLEKSGCSIAHLSTQLLDRWAEEILSKLQEAFGPLRNLTLRQTKQLLAGIVRIMRIRGGICADYLLEYMKNGNSFTLKKTQPFLPEFGKGRAPVFTTMGTGAPPRFDPMTGSGQSPTNYQKLLKRCWGDVSFYSDEIFKIIFEAGCRLDILTAAKCSSFISYGLNPAALELENWVDQYQCNKTRQMVSAPQSEREFWDRMPSFRLDEPEAILILQTENQQDYYGELYRYGKIHRVNAKEHTGLLERDIREALEKSFIAGTELAAPNILSCTPTLEMGIDIGDLSSVILCSMPPFQANYVQRIGRAGRRDGNAFNFVVAAGRPHDLHFFAEPLEMIAGQVTPPGVFLNAPAVLERQLTAFCLDRWIEAIAGDSSKFPDMLKFAIDAVAAKNQNKFPYTLLNFIELHREILLNGFCEIFPNTFTPETREHLQNFMRNAQHDGLARRILSRLEFIHKERQSLQEKLKNAKNKLAALSGKPEDQAVKMEKDDLQYEKHALQEALVQLNRKSTLNFFTDEGLLPNYAFPEAGVTLRSVIYRKHEGTSAKTGKYETISNEYERPGRSAIQEFAPGNAFYVDGRKLIINRINMTDTIIERWHFCGCCNEVEKVTDEQHSTTCPKCGSPSWADGNMTRNVLKMKQVIANQSDRESRSFDESEEREPIFYNKFMLAALSPEYVEKAYKSSDENFPFGLEFLRKATFREVNFGEQDGFEGDSIEIAARKVPRTGFQVCRDCGAVAENGKPFRHDVLCKHYGKTETRGIIECLYLYREFESEALRLLLPLEDLNFDSKVNSFIAALYLGLKERFEGNVDHLQVMIHEEPLPDSSMRKRYLVLYDQIPGGTGYLKQLANTPDDFMAMIQVALTCLEHCPCSQNTAKDGCYSCLYAYRVSHDLPNISRRAAAELMSKLLEQRGKLEEIDTIENINVNALFESDLEARFIEGLRRSSYCGSPVEVNHEIINGKTAYCIKINRHSYNLEPQVEIGSADGVAVPCRADFLITALRQSRVAIHPIAIFTDGFQFHADLQNENYRFHKDLAQRMALSKSGRFHCWSLSYQDVMTRFSKEHANTPLTENLPAGFEISPHLKNLEKSNSFDALITFLANPNLQDWLKQALACSMAFSHRGRIREEKILALRKKMLEATFFDEIDSLKSESDGKAAFWARKITRGSATLNILSLLRQEDLRNPERISLTIRLSDAVPDIATEDFRGLWNDVLQAYNLLQFIPGTVVVTDQFIINRLSIPEIRECVPDNWQELKEVCSSKVHPLLSFASIHGWTKPEPGYELAGEQDEVLACAELAWEDKGLAILLSADDLETFKAHGWNTCIVGDDCDLAEINALYQQEK